MSPEKQCPVLGDIVKRIEELEKQVAELKAKATTTGTG